MIPLKVWQSNRRSLGEGLQKKGNIKNRGLGFLYGIASAISFGGMNVLVTLCPPEVPASEISFARGMLGVLLFLPIVPKMSHVFLTRTGLLLLGRSICGATAVVCLFVNLHQASVGDASSLSYLSAFFVVILSWLFLREHISRREWTGIAVVLVGVFLLQSPLGSSLPWSVMAVGLFGAFSAGLALLALREAAQKIPAPLIVWGLCFATAIFSALFLLFFPGEHWVWPGIIGSVFVFGVALLGLIGQVWLTHAYMRLPAPIASAITLSSVVWGVIFESAISYRLPGSGAMVSYAMILGGIFILHRRSPKPAKAGVPEVSC